jgi:hypothetical protein
MVVACPHPWCLLSLAIELDVAAHTVVSVDPLIPHREGALAGVKSRAVQMRRCEKRRPVWLDFVFGRLVEMIEADPTLCDRQR